MLGEGGTPLEKLLAAILEYQARELDPSEDNLPRRRAGMDGLEKEFSAMARRAKLRGARSLSGTAAAATWISRTCNMSVTSAADRLRVGEQLESLPKVADALGSGQIGYQSASLLCPRRDGLGEKRERFVEDEMLGHARDYSVFDLRKLCNAAKHAADPDRFFEEAGAVYTRRRLHISQMPEGTYVFDVILAPEHGAAWKTALEPLAKRRGQEDDRSRSQRIHDANVELRSEEHTSELQSPSYLVC